MEGKIEFFGGKQMFISGEFMLTINQPDLISGDIVLFKHIKNIILLKRKEQPVIGIVKNIYNGYAYLHITNFSLVCKYTPKIINNDNNNNYNKYNIGDRLLIWLHSDGDVSVKNKYSLENYDDVKCLLDMYTTIKEDFDGDGGGDSSGDENVVGDHLYTINEIINHNDLDTFTIDPTNSVDFDDAISVDVNNKIIYVHIVDIAGVELKGDGNKRLKG